MYFNAQTQRFESVFGGNAPTAAYHHHHHYDHASCASRSPLPEPFADVDAAGFAAAVDYLPAESVCFDKAPILAERFRTKMCRSYERTGDCPYVHRCMFAHGEHELRTKAMNLADGLVTEEAIKNFKKANFEARKAAAAYAAYAFYTSQHFGLPAAYPASLPAAASMPPSPAPSPLNVAQCATPPMASYLPSDDDAVSNAPTTPPASPAPQARVAGRGYRHDPYRQLPAERSPVLVPRQ